MKGHVATHEIEGVPGMGGMDRGTEPGVGGELAETERELSAGLGKTLQSGLQVHPQETVFRFVGRLIGHDSRTVFREDAVQTCRPHWLHHGQMAEVLVS